MRNLRMHKRIEPICQGRQGSAEDKLYKKMAGNFGTSTAYKAATELVFKGLARPSGYTVPLLHAWRLKVKAAA